MMKEVESDALNESAGNLFELVVPPKTSKERLDKFITRFIGSFSRARLQKAIAENLVLVDGVPAKASHVVTPGQLIIVNIPKPKKVGILPEKIPLDIPFEDENLLVINKPAGMVVHPAFANYSGTLVNALMHHCGELSSVGGRQRPGIVHRLDKDTSGLMVVAKNDLTHQSLSEQFKARTTERIYHAITWHKFKKNSGRVQTFLARSPKDRKRITVQETGKLAITNYKVLESLGLLSLVQLKLETGRTHQIRVHLSYLGHPVFGDLEYGGRNRQIGGLSKKNTNLAAEYLNLMKRQALHAKTLGFFHPVRKEQLYFDSPLPTDLQLLLDRLRNENSNS